MRGCFPLSSFGGKGWGEKAPAVFLDYRPEISSSGVLLQPIRVACRAQLPPLPDPLLQRRRGKLRCGRRTSSRVRCQANGRIPGGTPDSSGPPGEPHWGGLETPDQRPGQPSDRRSNPPLDLSRYPVPVPSGTQWQAYLAGEPDATLRLHPALGRFPPSR